MHWYEDLQFIYVLEGEIAIEMPESSTTICRREGVFINKEIAAGAGFRQVSHLGKCFREKTGLSPRDYRKGERAKSQTMKG